MKPSKVIKKETYVSDNGVKIYAEHRLEHNDVQATIVWSDDNWQMMSFPTIWGFKQFAEKNDFELISK
tara:strand:- start:34 stop:237 length:204 start_codon:yes stop_codon:yes gene_type:complete